MILVERDLTGSWWSDFMREGAYSESVDLASSQYGLPIRLGSVGDDTMLSLATEVARRFATELSKSDQEEIVALAKKIDPGRRPLFAMIAAAAQLVGIPQQTKEEIVRSVLARETARWRTLIPDTERRERALNLLALATILGGLNVSGDVATDLWNSQIGPLLPDQYFFDDRQYAEIAGGSTGDSNIQGLQPDLIGEAFLLDRLRGAVGTIQSTRRLVDAGWDLDPEAVSQFVRRVVTDFPGDTAARLLQEPVSRTKMQREAWSGLVADIVAFQIASDDQQGLHNLAALRYLTFKYPSELTLIENRARAEFNFGTLLLQVGSERIAEERFTLAISIAATDSDIQANALNNRGIARLSLGSRGEGLSDFSAVIAMTNASDEARACAFNNRADIFEAENDLERSIMDRSSVLNLTETSYNRRFIARIRRSSAYLQLGLISEALDDLVAILRTDDIVPEQKMQAHLARAWILRQQELHADAIVDLDRVVESPLNFKGAIPDALVLRGNAYFALGKDEEALRDFVSALAQDDASGSTIAEAYGGSGAALAAMGQLDDARVALTAVLEHPEASEHVKRRSLQLITSLEQLEDH